jgi:hypothetical protein
MQAIPLAASMTPVFTSMQGNAAEFWRAGRMTVNARYLVLLGWRTFLAKYLNYWWAVTDSNCRPPGCKLLNGQAHASAYRSTLPRKAL